MGDASLGAVEISSAADSHHVVAAASETVVAVAASGGGEVHEAGSGDTDMVGDASNSAEEGAATDKGIRSEEGDRNNAGNRWPRQETLALLKIRSDMDATFRDSTLKGPLWEEISRCNFMDSKPKKLYVLSIFRKMAELGYQRSSKKCKEKFENVYKYHKRTKEGRTGKSEGKTYRFFDQLEAFETHHSYHHHHHQPLHQLHHPPSNKPAHQVITTTASSSPWTTTTTTTTTNSAPTVSHIFAPSSTNPTTIPPLPPPTNPINSLPLHTKSVVNYSLISDVPSNNSFPNNISANLFSSSTSSSTASDEEFQARHKRKRKWKDFFKKLTKEVLRKQEELQKKFLEAVEKNEHERMVREEAWRLQEMTRINREHEILVQERSTAAAKDAAVIAFLQKVSGGGGVGQVVQNPNDVHDNLMTLPPPQPPQPTPPQQLVSATTKNNSEVAKLDFVVGDNNAVLASPSRWPKAEVQALIQLRTCLDLKYQDNGPKGPLWEEISAGMRRLGYNRSAKRCKEKWENINKYFKKVKDNNKKRPEDSKTCPYFQQLDALYREKNNRLEKNPCNNIAENNNGANAEKPVPSHMGIMEPPLMVQPERQWPAQQENQLDSVIEEMGRENITADPNQEEDDDDDDGDSTEDDEDRERGGYEIINNKQPSMDMVE
ncbi:hypothetical protein FNV43_RR10690 [Rhamnella rubrinervis]|uniref:Myb-like domain-containing protein n=1 Tax=Rhamnella rubrinervis TaxID=2594499 RepID=A0A8K0H4P2_9ROSA|nr:hypothetical protein FNV43_RR10690 [Rhamnella rubrinervis]